MSVFGGDSWAREAQHRKRRVDDMVAEGLDGSSYKKLSSGKYACLICPHNPVLDTLLMLSIHRKGSRHIAAESRLKERELMRQDEINKRLATSDSSVSSSNANNSSKKIRKTSKPLIEQTQKAASEILGKETSQQHTENQNFNLTLTKGHAMNVTTYFHDSALCPEIQVNVKLLAQHQLDLKERRERELKFVAAGWKRDGHGKWFRDENVEFDSDEEDPNVCLA